jgi:predicted Na+-dependent transporter
VLPLALGIAVRRFARDFATRIEPAISLAAFIVLGLVAVLILASSAKGILAQIGDGTAALMAGS